MNYELTELITHFDDRGCLAEILRDDEIKEDIKQIYFSISKKGAIRGNHYHEQKIEWFSVLKGEGTLVLEDNYTKKREVLTLRGDKPKIVKIPPQTSHAIQNLSDEKMFLLVVVNEVYDPENEDTYFNKII